MSKKKNFPKTCSKKCSIIFLCGIFLLVKIYNLMKIFDKLFYFDFFLNFGEIFFIFSIFFPVKTFILTNIFDYFRSFLKRQIFRILIFIPMYENLQVTFWVILKAKTILKCCRIIKRTRYLN